MPGECLVNACNARELALRATGPQYSAALVRCRFGTARPYLRPVHKTALSAAWAFRKHSGWKNTHCARSAGYSPPIVIRR
jgi:hypothetical protein